jgi:hypothetical protein
MSSICQHLYNLWSSGVARIKAYIVCDHYKEPVGRTREASYPFRNDLAKDKLRKMLTYYCFLYEVGTNLRTESPNCCYPDLTWLCLPIARTPSGVMSNKRLSLDPYGCLCPA